MVHSDSTAAHYLDTLRGRRQVGLRSHHVVRSAGYIIKTVSPVVVGFSDSSELHDADGGTVGGLVGRERHDAFDRAGRLGWS
jgi:hypothetical protein